VYLQRGAKLAKTRTCVLHDTSARRCTECDAANADVGAAGANSTDMWGVRAHVRHHWDKAAGTEWRRVTQCKQQSEIGSCGCLDNRHADSG
jgi:hypothetical protein